MKQTRWPAIALIASALISVASATLAQDQITEPEMPFECAPAPKPVVSLSIGSRYEKGSETRSEISDESNADVNRALEPVEDFINDLSGMANAAYLGEVDSEAKANCVMAWLNVWAEGDALTRLNSLNARLAVSPRLAGLALAFLQVEKIATPDPKRDKQTIAWLGERADEVIEFFETEAGPLASTNNLRAWAALATASIGQISGDETVLAWARESYKLIVCGAEDSGALPAEMERGDRALHYQLHALAPLVVAVTILDPGGEADEELCRSKLEKVAEFTLASLKDPSIVAALVGEDQVFSGEDESELATYQLAWAEPFLRRYPNPALEAFVAPLRPLRYSKLGGNLTAIYAARDSASEPAVSGP